MRKLQMEIGVTSLNVRRVYSLQITERSPAYLDIRRLDFLFAEYHRGRLHDYHIGSTPYFYCQGLVKSSAAS